MKTTNTLDYSNISNWAYIETNKNKNIDVFYVYPTLVESSNYMFATINEMSKSIGEMYKLQASVFSTSCNIYIPYYRQATLDTAKKCKDYYSLMNFLSNNIPYYDIENALDYYFKHYNKNKPFIIAGHSQGSMLIILLLTKYFNKHKEYIKKMICAYIIGCAPSISMINQYNYLKFATNKYESGVIVSWNTEGEKAYGPSIILPNDPYVINPLNWTITNKYASVKENKGSLNPKTGKIGIGIGDAQINLKRGTLMCRTINDFIEPSSIFQVGSLHQYDYSLYYNNIRYNVLFRINNYLYKKD